jgi:hypothetical protein
MHQNKRKEKLNIENRELLSRSFILAILWLDMRTPTPYTYWTQNLNDGPQLYNCFVVVMLYHNPMNFFDNFFALPLSTVIFHSKQLNNSLKIHWRSYKMVIFFGRTLYGKPILLVLPVLTIKLMHTRLLLILQDVPSPLIFSVNT